MSAEGLESKISHGGISLNVHESVYSVPTLSYLCFKFTDSITKNMQPIENYDAFMDAAGVKVITALFIHTRVHVKRYVYIKYLSLQGAICGNRKERKKKSKM